MIIVECIQIALFAALGILASVSDLKKGVVSNRSIVLFGATGIVLASIYYGYFARDIIADFLINFAILLVLAFALYIAGIWAAGDVKLLLVLVLLIPARLYISINSNIYTLFIGLALSFLLGYIYFLTITIHSYVSKEIIFKGEKLKTGLINWLKAYGFGLLFYVFFECIYIGLIKKHIRLDTPVLILVFLILVYGATSIKLLRKGPFIIAFMVIDCAGCVYLKILPISTNYYFYLIAIALASLQQLLQENTYRQILASDVKAGMILSASSSVLLISTGVALPRISKENQHDRLSSELAERIRTWGIGTTYEITIVQKIPFALFIFLGLFIYCVVGGLLCLS